MRTDKNTWTFPKHIEMGLVPAYAQKLEEVDFSDDIVFDLSLTEDIHSAFIGFLILVKQNVELGGGRLIMNISPSIAKLFLMLNLRDFFSNAVDFLAKKTA